MLITELNETDTNVVRGMVSFIEEHWTLYLNTKDIDEDVFERELEDLKEKLEM